MHAMNLLYVAGGEPRIVKATWGLDGEVIIIWGCGGK